MSQSLTLKAKGLYTHPNDLSEVPEGALAVADNIVINKEGVAEPRRGFDKLTYALPNINDRANKLFSFQSKLLAHYGTTSLSYYDISTGWQTYSGSYSAIDVDLTKVRSAEANSNFYFTTDSGIKALDAYNSTPRESGMVKGLDLTGTLSGATGFMATNTQVAYRVLWGRRDANNNLILGAPSQRSIVSNSTGGTRDVAITITIPSGVLTTDFYQVYRSPGSATSSTEPSDELGLVYESNPTAGEITAKSLTFTDSTPDSLRGATIYTASTQEGILQANDQPPLAKDLAVFKGSTLYTNVKSKQRLFLTILATGGASGIALNDTITINSMTFTAKAAENSAANEFKLFTAGTPSQNIADTAQSLVKIINASTSNTSVYAYYISGYSDLPGKILLEARSLGASSFAAIASAHGSAYSPTLPTSGTTISSSNDTYLNGIYISKFQQPEAVPLTNLLFAGSAGKEILRVVPLRDSAYILKEDGVYRIVGDSVSNFRIEPFDTSTKLLAPETAVVLNNQIFCLSDQGVIGISDTGVQVLSRPIEIDLLQLFGDSLDALKKHSFAISYETERKFILFTVSASTDTYATQAYVYNTFTNTWTRWDLAKKAGIVNPADDKLYLSVADSSNVNIERKSYTFRDYIDEGESYTVSAVNGTVLTLTSLTGIMVGDLVYQSSTIYSQVTSIDIVSSTITVLEDKGFTAGSITIYTAIECDIEWVPQTAGNPGVMKHYSECVLLFKNQYFPTANIGFRTDLSPSVEFTEVSGTFGGLWGYFSWGSIAWGGTQRPKPIRTYIPLEKARCSQLVIRYNQKVAYSMFQLEGLSLFYNLVSQRLIK
jgi:hypothetical protein